MTVEIQLTEAQLGSTLFDLYSNIDGFTIPFETNIPVGSLTSPYQTSLVPDNTTIIRVQSVSTSCINFIDILLTTTTTTSSTSTTTTVVVISCNNTVNSGGSGVTEYILPLQAAGGNIILDFNAAGVPDKLEIIHNNTRMATSSMTGLNSGPFDTLYGDPTEPTSQQVSATTEFIGSTKGAIFNRKIEFVSDTNINTIFPTKQQLVWWVYTPTDYSLNTNVTLRITGGPNTGWVLDRLCEPELISTDIIFNTDGTSTILQQYDPITEISTKIFEGTEVSADVAHTATKLWLYGSALEILEYDIALNPFTITSSRTLTNIYDDEGLYAIDDTTLITINDQDVYETDITSTVAVNTFKFSLPAGRVCTGSFVLTTGGKFIILNDDNAGNYYISQYNYATGAAEFDIDITSTTTTPTGLYQYNNLIHISSESGTIHSILSTTPNTTTLVDTILEYNARGAGQVPGSFTVQFT
jgi:hypothetical protein